MKYRITAMTFLLAASCSLRAEAPVIRSVDMFYQVDEYFRAHANDFDPHDSASRYPVPPGLIQPAGENLLWNFRNGPKEVVHRFDYVDPTSLWEAAEFPGAKVAEHKTIEGRSDEAWLFFEQIPGIGRKVYGFYDEIFAPYSPGHVFDRPIIDFPENIRYGQAPWFTDMSFYSTIAYSDSEVSTVVFPVFLEYHSKFTADAWGLALLPEPLNILPVLRVNEEQSVDISIDFAIEPGEEGNYQYVETDYMRNYYWLSPGKGIVAQLNSTQGSFLPDPEFGTASVFLVMFETNKEWEEVVPEKIQNLEVTVSSGFVWISWGKASTASSYRVEYSTGGLGADDWQTLEDPNSADEQALDQVGGGGTSRFYRVIGLP